jgi:hypothetical protein
LLKGEKMSDQIAFSYQIFDNNELPKEESVEPWYPPYIHKDLEKIRRKVLWKTRKFPTRNKVNFLREIPIYWGELPRNNHGKFFSRKFDEDLIKQGFILNFDIYDALGDNFIVVNRMVNQSWIPDYSLERLIFHEALHHKIVGHGRRFREWESWYPEYEKAKSWDMKNWDRVRYNREILKRKFIEVAKEYPSLSPSDLRKDYTLQIGPEIFHSKLLGHIHHLFDKIKKPLVFYSKKEDIYLEAPIEVFLEMKKNPVANLKIVTKEDIIREYFEENYG